MIKVGSKVRIKLYAGYARQPNPKLVYTVSNIYSNSSCGVDVTYNGVPVNSFRLQDCTEVNETGCYLSNQGTPAWI